MIPIEWHVEVLATDGTVEDATKWACNVDPSATWGEITYGALAMVRNSDKALSMQYTTAAFALQPNRTTLLQPSKQNPESLIFDVKDHMDEQEYVLNLLKSHCENN